MKQTIIFCAAVSLMLLAGCFKEPTPGYKVLPEGSQVYLSGKGLKDLSSESAALALGDRINYLNLDRNAFDVLPPEIPALTGLKWLRLNENNLSALPAISPPNCSTTPDAFVLP